MNRCTLATAAAAVAALGLAVAGCGGGSDASTTTTALSKDAFIQQADGACKAGNKKVDQLAQRTFSKGQKPTQAQLKQFANQAIPIIQSEVGQVKALTPPQGDEPQVQAITDAAQKGIDQLKSDPTLLAQPGNQAFEQANQLARSYGLKVCGNG